MGEKTDEDAEFSPAKEASPVSAPSPAPPPPPPPPPPAATPKVSKPAPAPAKPGPATAPPHSSAKRPVEPECTFCGVLCSILTNFGYFIWLVLVILQLLTILACSLFLLLVHSDLGDLLAAYQPPCVTKKCIETSGSILGKMNLSSDPCTDMYEYACGNHDSRAILGVEETSFSTLDGTSKQIKKELHKLLESTDTKIEGQVSSALAKAKTYYESCMDRFKIRNQSLSKLQRLINDNGSWNLTTHGINPWNSSTWSLQASLVKMHKLDTGVLFDTVVRPNIRDTDRYIVMLLPARYSAKDELLESQAGIDTLVAATVNTVQTFSGDDDVDRGKIEALYEFEKQLYELTRKQNTMTNPPSLTENLTATTLDKLQDTLGSMIDLKAYLKELVGGTKQFTAETEIVAGPTVFYASLQKLVAGTEKEVLANYLIWHMITQHLEYLSEYFIQPLLPTITRGDRVSSLAPVKERCFAQTEQVFGLALGALYVKENVRPELKEKVMNFLKEIKKQFMDGLKKQEWLDNDSRTKVSRKAEIMTANLGYPDWILDPIKLDQFYKQFNIQKSEYLYNYVSARTALKQHKMQRYSKPVDRSEWDMDVSPYGVKAVYDTHMNGITVPAGLFRAPLYVPSVSEAHAYGSVGSILGREFLRGFDTTRVMYDQDGEYYQLLSPDIHERFAERTACLVEQYDKFQ
ncbi:unnamed protein product, partial [Lymnaea stagnalis]